MQSMDSLMGLMDQMEPKVFRLWIVNAQDLPQGAQLSENEMGAHFFLMKTSCMLNTRNYKTVSLIK